MTTAIALFVYNRPEHTQHTLDTLRRCSGISEFPLSVFCDGPKDDSEKPLVQRTREAFRGLEWPAPLALKESELNQGLAGSIVSGVGDVLNRYDSVIVIEDDLLLAQEALRYFQAALDAYRNNTTVVSISGFSLPPRLLRIPHGYPYDAYFLTRNSSWGWATWRDRWNAVSWDINTWTDLRTDPYVVSALKRVGPDLPRMLDRQASGKIDSWSVRFTWHHFLHGGVSLVPVRSYVHNNGLDGSGMHMERAPRLTNNLDLAVESPVLPPFVHIDPIIARRFAQNYRGGSLPRRVVKRLVRLLTSSK